MLFPKGTSHNQQSFVVEKAQAFSCTPWEKLTQATNEIHRPPTIHGQPGLSLPFPPPLLREAGGAFLVRAVFSSVSRGCAKTRDISRRHSVHQIQNEN